MIVTHERWKGMMGIQYKKDDTNADISACTVMFACDGMFRRMR